MNIFYEPRRNAWKRAHSCKDCFFRWSMTAILAFYVLFGVIGTFWLAWNVIRSCF